MSRVSHSFKLLAVALVVLAMLGLSIVVAAEQPSQGAASVDAGVLSDGGALVDAGMLPDGSETGLAATDAGDAGPADAGADAGDAGLDEENLTREEKAFLYDLRRLTAKPHRVAGSPEGQAAANYIQKSLEQIGFKDIYPLEMPVWTTRTERCELAVGGTTLEAFPMRPNITALPVTPKQGFEGPLLYVGAGGIDEYGGRSAEGAVVVLDYDSHEGWRRAFALGARAVVFVGKGNEVPVQPKRAGVPANQIRLYVPEDADVDLRRDYPKASVACTQTWQRSSGRNLIVRIKGTDPGFSPERSQDEAIVLAVGYDSFGTVPERSPGARVAANVAALLESAAQLKKNPPRRDVVLMFLDNEARYHQGAREVYDALQLEAGTHATLREQHAQELAHVKAMQGLLRDHNLRFSGAPEPQQGASPKLWLKRALQDQADFARDDIRKKLQVLRLAVAGGRSSVSDAKQIESELSAQGLRWDEIRRALHEDTLSAFVRIRRQQASGTGVEAKRAQQYLPIFDNLQARATARFDRRLVELEEMVRIDNQRDALRRGLRGKDGEPLWMVLHVDYNLSDTGPNWGVVVGDWTNELFSFRTPRSEADTPGYYGRVLNAFSEAAKELGDDALPALDPRTLSDPMLGMTFAPGRFFSSGFVAGTYGLYNVSVMTGYDARPRDGHPADHLYALDWQHLRGQALQATRLIAELADIDGISLPQVFKAQNKSKHPEWSSGQSDGDYAGLQVSGSLAEDRPASGAVMAMWPANGGWEDEAWRTMEDALNAPSFDPIVLEPIDENGRFRLIGLREDMHSNILALGTIHDPESGEILAITTQEHLLQKLAETMRVNMFFGDSYRWSMVRTYDTDPGLFKVLKAASDSPFRSNRALWGQLENDYFAYVSDQVVDYRLKVFQPMGPVALGEFGDEHPHGNGLAPPGLQQSVHLSPVTAEDIWALNESRLAELRARGVTSADLELLHSRAKRQKELAKLSESKAEQEAALARSASLSQRVYMPLRSTMDDLVHAIVILLLLAIPFAFALERLLVCATSIYGRIAGFTALFLITFGILFVMHPGFAIASTPIIIFLAFAIILLTGLVIYIVVRKFKTELKAMQGQAVGVHDLEVSRMGTMLAAVGMGMSTMRRRPTRTTLTAVTVVILTFTILAFASFSRTVGVRAVYEGPASETTRAKLFVRQLDYSAMPEGIPDMLRGQEGEGGLIAAHYWLPRDETANRRSSVARLSDGEPLTTDAIMGISLVELDRWPELASALGPGSLESKRAALKKGAVYLPPIIQDVLKLQPGDAILLNGHRVEFAGTVDSAQLQRLKHLDGESVLPVDFQDPSSMATGGTADSSEGENELLMAEDVERDFVHLSSDQVVIGSAELVKQLGGDLHAVAVYPAEGVDVPARGRKVAELLVMPVWASGPEGVERLILTVLTEVSGGLALFVPLLLGGLIIFGTLLGSISDREREIYTFSALGLSPGHVGVLFFSEAAVYAVVGGMGGQLMAQFVALGATELAKAGYIQPTSINYSSTNSLFAIGVVMLTVLVSAIYPAVRASKSANPGLARAWKMPPPEGDELKLTFPFTVSAYDITGVVSFLAEHFRRHDDAGLGSFAASKVNIRRTSTGNLELSAELALAPFDLGVTQKMRLTAVPSQIEGVDEVAIHVTRLSGAAGDWIRSNRVFLRDLRRQFLLWRTLSNEMIEHYRMQTLETLGVVDDSGTPTGH